MGSKAAIPIWLPEGKERARLPQAEGLSRLGLWPPGGPGEAGLPGAPACALAAAVTTGQPRPRALQVGRETAARPSAADVALPVLSSSAPRKLPQGFAPGAGVSVSTRHGPASSVLGPPSQRSGGLAARTGGLGYLEAPGLRRLSLPLDLASVGNDGREGPSFS